MKLVPGIIVAVPLGAYLGHYLASELIGESLPMNVTIVSMALAATVLFATGLVFIMRDYPTESDIEFDRRIRYSMGENDNARPEE